ncbi:MAG: CBS domain-containing protein [Syntrophales bacterium]
MKIHYKGFMRERIRKNPVTINPNASFFEARKLIWDKGVRHLPVVDENSRLLGIVTESDIRKAGPSDVDMLRVQEAAYLLKNLKVSAFMTPKEKLVTITPDALIEEAVQLMHDNKIGCLPVLEEGKLYGIFTETDALDHLVDVFGSKEKGTRLTVALEDKPGVILGVFEVFKKHNVNVISVVTPSFMVEGMRIAAIRIRTEEYEPIVKDLEKAGYKVLSIGKWASAEWMIPQIKKILYATDLSKNSVYAFFYAVDMAKRYNANIVILHSIEPIGRHIYAEGGPDIEDKLKIAKKHEQEMDIEEIKRRLREFCKNTETQIGFPCVELVSKILVPLGHPVEEILKTADDEGCDAIVLGTHGKGFLEQTFLGSVAGSVLERSRKPVFTIPLPSEKTDIDWDKI